jgi:hypothetical protein
VGSEILPLCLIIIMGEVVGNFMLEHGLLSRPPCEDGGRVTRYDKV